MPKRVKAVVIRCAGPVEVVPAMSFEEMQAAVGGFVESFRFLDDVSAYVNEDGIALGLPENVRATRLCSALGVGLAPGDFIKGTMVLVGSPDDEGEMQDLPQYVTDLVEKG